MVPIDAAEGCLSDRSSTKRQIYETSFMSEEALLKKGMTPPSLKAVLFAIFKDPKV